VGICYIVCVRACVCMCACVCVYVPLCVCVACVRARVYVCMNASMCVYAHMFQNQNIYRNPSPLSTIQSSEWIYTSVYNGTSITQAQVFPEMYGRTYWSRERNISAVVSHPDSHTSWPLHFSVSERPRHEYEVGSQSNRFSPESGGTIQYIPSLNFQVLLSDGT
jgi:hypothetical protein